MHRDGEPMKPLLKWAGGKARLAPQIADAFGQPCAGTYYEPFVGSAAVYLHLRSRGLVRKVVLSDANPKLVEVHRSVRDHVYAVLQELRNLPGDDWRERYYDVRDAFNAGPHVGPSHAARFLWLNRACFNGLYRENRSGRFNVPVGRYAKLSFPSDEHFRDVSALLADAEIVCGGYEAYISGSRDGDHVYCDPPYVPLTETANFVGYCGGGFGMDDQRALARKARAAAFAGVRVVLSNHDLPVVRDELYPEAQGFEYVAAPKVRRAISRSAATRKAVGEVIVRVTQDSVLTWARNQRTAVGR